MGGKNSIVNIKLAGVSSMFMFMFILIIFVVIVIYKYYKDKENKGIDCIGEFTECNSKCLKTYIQTSPSSGNGKDCPFSNNSTVVCFDNEGLCNTNKEEYISKSKNNKLNVEVSLDYNINEIPEGSLERDVFEDNFKDEISKTIGVDINKIEILEIIEGSVNVIFTINEEDTLDSDNIIQSINTISELSDIPIIDSRIQLQPLDVIYCSNNNDILEDYQCQGDTILRSRSHEIIKYIDENVDDNIINERCCIDKKKCNTDPDIVEECINIDKIINNINYCDKNECIISRDIEQCCQDMTCEEAIENELVDCYAIDGKENISDLNIIGNTNDICCVDEPDIDCIGEWSTCTQDCSDKIYNISVFQSGKGRDCDYEDGDIDECNPGDDDCPRDCDGEWSPCDENCESIWTEYASKSGNGAACPDTPLCNPGDGDCPRNCDGLSPPTNGQMNTCTETILHGSSCIKECDTGYTLSGIQPSCDDGTLTDTVECIKDIDCTGYWSPCNDECISTYSVILDQSGSGVSCLIDDGQTQECNPGEGSCPRDCAGSWSDCNQFCSRTWTETARQHAGGDPCPDADACNPGDGDCPPDIDCDGTWIACTAACEDADDRIWSQTAAQSGNGDPCPVAEKCNPGDGDCPPDIDCAGTWRPCTAACEDADDRVWDVTDAQSGKGAPCPVADACNPGDGDCPVDCAYTRLDAADCTGCGEELTDTVVSTPDGRESECTDINTYPCAAGDGACPVDCAYTRLDAADCTTCGEELTDTVVSTPARRESECPDINTYTCVAGDGACPRDCAGSWSDCNEFCSRTWIQTVAPSSNGEECPSLTDTTQSGGPHVCRPGDGACPDRCLELEELGLAWFGRKEPDEDTREPIWKKGHGCRNAPNRNSADQGTMSWWNYYTHGTDPVCNEDNSTWMEWHVVDTGTRAEEDGHDYGRRCEGTIGEGNRPCTVDDCLDPKSGGGSPGTYNCRWNDENLPWEPNQESIINNSLLCIDPTLSIRGHDGDSRCHNPDVCSDDSIGPPACLYSYCKAPDTNYFNANRTLADMKWTRANYRIYEGNVARPGKCKEVARVLGGNTGEQDCVPRTCGTPDNFDCSSHAYDLHASPSTVPCATDSCTDTECCTVIPESPATVSQVPATGTEELGRVGDRAAGSSLPVSLEEVQVGPTAPPAAAVLSSQALLGHRPSSLSHLAQPASSSSSSSSSSSRSFWDDLDEFLPFR